MSSSSSSSQHRPCEPLSDDELHRLADEFRPPRYSVSELVKILGSPAGLAGLTVNDLKIIMKFLNTRRNLNMKVSGNKPELKSRLELGLFGRRFTVWAAPPTTAPPPGRPHPHAVNDYSALPPPVSPMTGQVPAAPAPRALDDSWQKLRKSHFFNYSFMNNMVARQFFHGPQVPAARGVQPELALDFQMSFGAGRFRDPDTRFFLHIFNRSTNDFVSDANLRRTFRIHVNSLLLDHCPTGSEMQQFVDLTSQFKHLPEKSNVRVHITGPHYFWADGIASVMCMSVRPISESVTRLYEQTLRLNGIQLPPPLVPLPPGYKPFENVHFQNLEDARQLFAERIVDKLPPTTLAKGRGGHDDDEIQMGNQIMSFQCPLSLTRIRNPTKSVKCVHKQCFDAESFLMFIRAPTSKSKCPVCNKILDCADLVIEPTFSRLLTKYPDADRCVILPSGEDQAIEEHQQQQAAATASGSSGTDGGGSQPNGSGGGGANGIKRKHSEMLLSDVIELSDDDEFDELPSLGSIEGVAASLSGWGESVSSGGAGGGGAGYASSSGGAASVEPRSKNDTGSISSASQTGLGSTPRPPWDGTVICLDD
ncbi:SUMO ligase siz1 [Geranomyces variabilis]|nr:SUMO ligase siz1 [Geranomyces variabilis]